MYIEIAIQAAIPPLADFATPICRLGGPTLLVNAYRKHGLAALKECTIEGRTRGRKGSKGAAIEAAQMDRRLVWSQPPAVDGTTFPAAGHTSAVGTAEVQPEGLVSTEQSAEALAGALSRYMCHARCNVLKFTQNSPRPIPGFRSVCCL